MVSFRSIAASFASVVVLIHSTLVSADSQQRNPLSYVALLQDPVISSPSARCHAFSHFDLTFSLHDHRQKIRLALEPNHDIIHETMHVHYLAADGTVSSIEPIDRSEHRVFKGNAFLQSRGSSDWRNVGWARIVVHRDGETPIFEGGFRINGDNHHIQTGANYRLLKHREDPDVEVNRSGDEFMVVWRDSDIRADYASPEELKKRAEGATCSADSLGFNAAYQPFARDEGLQSVPRNSLFGRQSIDGTNGNNGAGVNLVSTIGQTRGCPNTRKVALMGVATDCTYTASFNSTQAVRANVIAQVNLASQVYESTFNISLGIQNLTISEASCPGQANSQAPWNVDCSPNVNINDRLSLFSAWRGLSNDNNAFWTLLSTCNTESAVGLAWLGQACVQGSEPNPGRDGSNETIASANVVIRTPTEWQVIAHEVGHTFGAVHDCTSVSCTNGDSRMSRCCPLSANQCDAGGQFIMNPSTGSGIEAFSPCSIGNICSGLLGNVRADCLSDNRNVNTITGSQCGNGIVESGEDCDCGGPQGCGNNPCCNPTTCKFSTGSVCDPANEDCCTRQCQFQAAGTVCRASTGFCDPQETCSGTSPMCPTDQHKNDGDACGESGQGLTCASGQCTSRDLQCKTLIGARTSSNDTYACSSQGCLLSCASPQFGPSMCVTMNQNFLDGTPCQGGGRCSNGSCKGSSFGGEIANWFRDNRTILIPVGSVVGGLLVLALLCCFVSSWRSSSRSKRKKRNQPNMSTRPNEWANYGGAWAPPPPQQQRSGSGQGGRRPAPPPPPPQYDPQQGSAPPSYWQPTRTMSARYA